MENMWGAKFGVSLLSQDPTHTPWEGCKVSFLLKLVRAGSCDSASTMTSGQQKGTDVTGKPGTYL